LAGELGVAIADSLIRSGHLLLGPDGGEKELFATFGIKVLGVPA
jgi:hypothetical protein